VWCAVNGRRTIGPTFYDKVNSELYMNRILEPLFQMFTEGEKKYEYFLEDNARAHTSQQFVAVSSELFGDY
jgi:hypothetical protein